MLEDSTQKKFSCQKNGDELVFPCADGTVKLPGKDQVFRTSTLNRDRTEQVEEHNDVLQEDTDGSYPADQLSTDDIEARDKFIFPCVDGTVKLAGKDREVRSSVHTRRPPNEGEEYHGVLHGEADRSDPA